MSFKYKLYCVSGNIRSFKQSCIYNSQTLTPFKIKIPSYFHCIFKTNHKSSFTLNGAYIFGKRHTLCKSVTIWWCHSYLSRRSSTIAIFNRKENSLTKLSISKTRVFKLSKYCTAQFLNDLNIVHSLNKTLSIEMFSIKFYLWISFICNKNLEYHLHNNQKQCIYSSDLDFITISLHKTQQRYITTHHSSGAFALKKHQSVFLLFFKCKNKERTQIDLRSQRACKRPKQTHPSYDNTP